LFPGLKAGASTVVPHAAYASRQMPDDAIVVSRGSLFRFNDLVAEDYDGKSMRPVTGLLRREYRKYLPEQLVIQPKRED
jgi:hypothetical protein